MGLFSPWLAGRSRLFHHLLRFIGNSQRAAGQRPGRQQSLLALYPKSRNQRAALAPSCWRVASCWAQTSESVELGVLGPSQMLQMWK